LAGFAHQSRKQESFAHHSLLPHLPWVAYGHRIGEYASAILGRLISILGLLAVIVFHSAARFMIHHGIGIYPYPVEWPDNLNRSYASDQKNTIEDQQIYIEALKYF
jgi:hypothetical protein